MGPGETTGIVIIVVAVLQGIFKLTEHVIAKYSHTPQLDRDAVSNRDVLDAVITSKCGLTESQAEQLRMLHELHNIKDTDGVPLWYVPRSWADTQKEIVNELRSITETQYKTLSLIERLEKKLED